MDRRDKSILASILARVSTASAKDDETHHCEGCHLFFPEGSRYFSLADCNDTGVGVALCHECESDLLRATDHVAILKIARNGGLPPPTTINAIAQEFADKIGSRAWRLLSDELRRGLVADYVLQIARTWPHPIDPVGLRRLQLDIMAKLVTFVEWA
jgi:hypothetical protein